MASQTTGKGKGNIRDSEALFTHTHAELRRVYAQLRKWEQLYREAYEAAREEQTVMKRIMKKFDCILALRELNERKATGHTLH